MKNKELVMQIEGMVESYISDFMDAYQCADWGVKAQQFAEILLKRFQHDLLPVARELDNECWEDEQAHWAYYFFQMLNI